MLIKGDDIKLFLTDLCGRICYRPKGVLLRTAFDNEEIEVIGYDGHFIDLFRKGDYDQASIDLVRLYLRPMSSMTEEEKKVVCSMNMISDTELNDRLNYQRMYLQNYTIETFDYFNEHHLDYRGLIPMSLALEAPEDIYPQK